MGINCYDYSVYRYSTSDSQLDENFNIILSNIDDDQVDSVIEALLN
jgi:hypothetical protein